MTATAHREDMAHPADQLNLSCPACYRTWQVLVATGQVNDYRAPGTDEEPWTPPLDITAGATRATALWLRAAGLVAIAGLAALVLLALRGAIR